MPKDAEAPWFQFYPDDFANDGDVEAMTTEEVGAYILLLCKAWREKPAASIPADDRVLARWSRLHDRWSECKPAVIRPWKLSKDGKRYTQPRLKKEYDKMLDRRRVAQQAATTAAKARWDNRGKDAPRMRNASPAHANGKANGMRFDAKSSSSPPPDIPPQAPQGGRERKNRAVARLPEDRK